ncbi:MAG: dipeptidase [Acidobacteriota bacterium]
MKAWRVGWCVIVAAAVSLQAQALGHAQGSADEVAARIHREAVVVDMHADTLLRVLDAGEDLGWRTARGDIDIPRMREGGLDCQLLAAWPSPVFKQYGFLKRSLDMIDAHAGLVESHPQDLVAARTVADIRAAAAAGKIATLAGIEGGHAIENDPRMLSIFARLGVRCMTLTWAMSTEWADSSGDKGTHGGLTPLGRDIVREMNRLGIAVDVSHVSDRTFYDVLDASSKPVIASHSSCRALAASARNLSDDQLRALAAKGGVVGINFYPPFLDAAFGRRLDAMNRRLLPELQKIDAQNRGQPGRAWLARNELAKAEARKLPGRVTISRLVDHIEHAVKVAGVDHVGLGADFDGIDAEIEGLEDCSKLPALTAELMRRGFTEQEVKKILGENFLRVLKEIIGQ